ncbi:MAG: hypothetical protein AAF667_10980 [Pseudomonadota bacterium]
MSAEILVITGDIVKSQQLAEGRLGAAFDALARADAAVGAAQGSDARLSRFRGDGWQMVLSQPTLGFRATVLIRAALRAADRDFATRIALGIGPDTLKGAGDLGGENGPAFVASGQALDGLPARRRSARGNAPAALAVALHLGDAIADGWTETQAALVFEALGSGRKTQAELARGQGITQQTVQQHLEAARFDQISAALSCFER